MGCVQSYFRKAHSAGLSPSSTQASENAGLIPDMPTEPVKHIAQEDAVITSQDAVREITIDSNGAPKTGLGLGPGVAALAASTGTVAILGATADTTLDVVEDVKQVAEEVVNDVKEAAEEAVKDAKTIAEDVGKEVADLVERVESVVDEIKSPSQEGKQTPELKEDNAVPTSPIQEVNKPCQDAKKDSSLPTTPLPEDTKSEGNKDTSLPTSPITEDNIPPVDSKEASALSSPVPPVNKETGEAKEEASLSLSSLPEDSIPSSIKEDAVVTSSPSSDEKPESLTESDKPHVQSPSAELESNLVQHVTEVLEKAASRPTSGVKADLAEKKEAEVADDTFPDPPPPEVQETASRNAVGEEDEAEGAKVRTKRSTADQETLGEQRQETPAQLHEEDYRPATVDEIETKLDEAEETVGKVEAETGSGLEVEAVQEPTEPTAESLEAAVVVETVSSLRPQNPQIEVSAPSRPQSSDVEFIGATSPEAEVKQQVPETIEQAGEKVAALTDKAAEKQETAEATKAEPEEDAPVRPTSAQVEEKAEEVVNEVVEAVTQMVTTAATTIQATFRGHQTRQHLRKIADQDELTDALSSELDKDADVTLSLDAKSSDTKEESSEAVEDSFPPPLNDADSELLSTSTEMEELQPVVNVTISAEPVDSRPESESEKVSEGPTAPMESELESVEGVVEEAPRAASVVSESTVSVGDSVGAVKGSETDSMLSASEEHGAGDAEDKKGAAATTIQASFRGFQARQNLHKGVDDTQLPVPEPLQDFAFEDVADEDDLPPPPEECDIDAPARAEDAVETPRSPETGEKLKKLAAPAQVSAEPRSSGANDEDGDRDQDENTAVEDARKLALLQRPQQCDELPEHRGEVAVEAWQEPKEDLVNGVLAADASSADVDDSSLSSAATKIQAGARGYLTRKLMKDTFSTTAPSITDSQSVGGTLTSDDGFHTSGSFETEVQRQKTSMDEQNIGVTAVVIANVVDKAVKSVENGISDAHDDIVASKGLSLDSQLPPAKKKPALPTANSETHAKDGVEDKQVWQTLQGEMEEAATKIQSNFRGYQTRQRLHRENAVQVTTSSGTPGTTSQSSETPPPEPPMQMRSSGEFHDMMVLPPEPADVKSDSWIGDDAAMARRQASHLGTRREGHVIDVPTAASGAVSAMGKARETTSTTNQSSVKEMKGASVAKAAATKIQAGFRGYKVRKQMKQLREKKSGPRRRSSVQPTQIVREKMSLQEKSATTIQAGVRGFLVRKRRLEEKNAAVKIQAGFRGYKVRRDVKTRAPVEK